MGLHHLPARPPRGRSWTAAGATLVAALTAFLVAPVALSSTPTAEAATGTYVRLAQLTDVKPDNELIISSVADPRRSVTVPAVGYGGVSAYRRIEPGDYVVAVRPVGSGKPPLVSTTLNAMPGTSYTLGAVGTKVTSGLTVFTDDLTPPAAGRAKLRVIDAAPPSPTMDVRGPGGTPFALGLACGAASAYREVDAGQFALSVGPPGGAATTLPVTVAANQIVTAVVVDRGDTVAAQVQVDAEGPVTVPPGPVDAGYGGTAGERPGAAAGAVALAVLAAVATGVAVRLGRKTGWRRQRS